MRVAALALLYTVLMTTQFPAFKKKLIEYWPHSLHCALFPLTFRMWNSLNQQPEVTELHAMWSQRLIQNSAISQSYCQSNISEEEIRKKQDYFERKHSLQPEHYWALHDKSWCFFPGMFYLQLSSSLGGAEYLVRSLRVSRVRAVLS